jgi:hypothetical protein
MDNKNTVANTCVTIEEVEDKMLMLEQADCPVTHTFGPGLYIREVRMPKGAIVIGHYQKYEHMNMFIKGKLLMRNEDGTTFELKAPQVFVGKPGRKVGTVIEDVIWYNIYVTNETDIKTLEDTYIKKSDSWREIVVEKDTKEIIQSYKKLLSDLNMTEHDVQKDIDRFEVCELPYGTYKSGVFASQIHGKGVFATANIKKNEIIGPALINGRKTIYGRFVNHSHKPNAKMAWIAGNIYLLATEEISGACGGQVGNEITTDYKQTLKLIRGESCHQLQQQL